MKNVDYLSRERDVALAVKLRRFRLQAGFSQKNVADILNVSRSTYTYYETGKTTPDPTTLNRIAKIYGVSLEEFFVEDASEESSGVLRDSESGRTHKRAPKKAKEDPQRVGDLSAGEKVLIAFLRDSGVSSDRALELLKTHFLPVEDQHKMF